MATNTQQIQADIDYYRSQDVSQVKRIKSPLVQELQRRVKLAEEEKRQALEAFDDDVLSWVVEHQQEANLALRKAMEIA